MYFGKQLFGSRLKSFQTLTLQGDSHTELYTETA